MQTYTVRFYDEFEHLMSACTTQAPGEITAIQDAATETKTRLSAVGRIEIERLDARENVELPGEATANPPAFRQRYAYVAVYTGPGTRCGIGRADEGESGYNPRPELGSFDSHNSAASHADKLNAELGLSIEESAKVIASTMR